eukprot:3964177-Amphidinium_carterae.1
MPRGSTDMQNEEAIRPDSEDACLTRGSTRASPCALVLPLPDRLHTEAEQGSGRRHGEATPGLAPVSRRLSEQRRVASYLRSRGFSAEDRVRWNQLMTSVAVRRTALATHATDVAWSAPGL